MFCLTDLIALAGHASTQALQVLPTHFSLLNTTERSSAKVIASTGHRAKHEPQLKHFSESTSMSLGKLTVTCFLRNALTTLSRDSAGTSASNSPPLELTCAVIMLIGILSSRTICEIIGCSTICSENLRRTRTVISYLPNSLETSSEVTIPKTFFSLSITGKAEILC